MTRRLAELRAPQVSERLSAGSIVLQPLGAIEQHGPHLPFDTDLVIASEVAEAGRRRVRRRLRRLAAAAARLHEVERARLVGRHGVAVGVDAAAVLDDIGRSVAMLPARKLVFVNGHGGNSALLNVANRELRLKYGLMTFLAHPGFPVDQGGTAPESELGMGCTPAPTRRRSCSTSGPIGST
jgi:creatinine amidohydrolase